MNINKMVEAAPIADNEFNCKVKSAVQSYTQTMSLVTMYHNLTNEE
jgi:hypothetical protein